MVQAEADAFKEAIDASYVVDIKVDGYGVAAAEDLPQMPVEVVRLWNMYLHFLCLFYLLNHRFDQAGSRQQHKAAALWIHLYNARASYSTDPSEVINAREVHRWCVAHI